jgi:uncharacterized protein
MTRGIAGYHGPMTEVGSRSQLAYVRANREEILSVIRRHRGQSVSVFGSVARGQERPGSDIDFLVEFGPSSSLFDLLHIKDELEALLGSPVDVVSLAALKDRDTEIRSEAIPL